MANINNRLKLAEQALAAHKSRLATAANKDQVRRQIAAAQRQVDALRETAAELSDRRPADG